jgi:hypothetical protein
MIRSRGLRFLASMPPCGVGAVEGPGGLVAATGFGSDSVERARWMKSCKASRSLASEPVASAWEACRPGGSTMTRPMQ